jgi:hypothetical protein
LAHSRLWHIRDIARSQIEVRFRCKSGHTADITVMAGFGPTAAIRQLILL